MSRPLPNFDEIPASEADVVSHLARAKWAAATSDSHEIANGRGAIYVLITEALQQALWTVYRLTDAEARHAIELLSEYGPDDQLTGTTRAGIASYAQFAKMHPRKADYW